MAVLKTYQIDPDGLPIDIPWDEFEVETSMFIPCIAGDKAVKQLRAEATKRGIKIECRLRVEKMLGVRVWRIA